MTTTDFNEQLTVIKGRLLGYAVTLTRDVDNAKDLVQESMIKALMNREKFQDGTNFNAWMHTIARNTFINEDRRVRRGQRILDHVTRAEAPVISGPSTQGPLSALSTSEIQGLIDRLPATVRTPFQMNLDGFKYHEIADEMNIPIGTVKSRIFQARQRLTHDLEGHRMAA